MKKYLSIVMAAIMLLGFVAVAAAADDFEALEFEAELAAEAVLEAEAFDAPAEELLAQEMTDAQLEAFAEALQKVAAALEKLSPAKQERLLNKFNYLNARKLYEVCPESNEFYLAYFNFYSYELAIFFPLTLWQGLVEDGFLSFLYAAWNFIKFIAGGTMRYVWFGWLWMGL